MIISEVTLAKLSKISRAMVSEKEGLQKYPLVLHLAIIYTGKRDSGNLEGFGWKDTISL
jgi:hypothetical protein